ncbi:MAG: hypothetical protein JO339_20505, partial [Alphaproteobacteria bacterium]|nr:hypothetical protein [Alphaproteobacteria bacterium]
GRFLQPDPVGYLGGSNLYAYAANDPLNLIDPSGLAADAPVAAAGASGGGGSQRPPVAAAAAGGAGGGDDGDGGDDDPLRKFLLARLLRLSGGGGTENVGPRLIGAFAVPTGLRFGTTTFGNYAHRAAAEILQELHPNVPFEFRVLPGQRGVDVTVPAEFAGEVGYL